MGHPAAIRPSSAFVTVDFDKPGKQIGFVMIPHSPHDDAWGVTQVPLAVIANGRGPTVIVEGGNHGDEYEGPITIGELIRDLDPDEVQGRLILMPANNVHAVMAGRRTSPVDGLNFNRSFPGDPRGTITEQIAAYVADHMLPLGDAFLDLHSGGSSLDILPSAIVEPTDDPDLRRRNIAAVAGLRRAAHRRHRQSRRAAHRDRRGLPCRPRHRRNRDGRRRTRVRSMRSPSAGAACATSSSISACSTRATPRPGARTGCFSSCPAPPPTSSRPPTACSSPSTRTAARSAPASRRAASTFTWDPAREPETLHYAADGLLYGRRQPGAVRPGNCCLIVASPLRGRDRMIGIEDIEAARERIAPHIRRTPVDGADGDEGAAALRRRRHLEARDACR